MYFVHAPVSSPRFSQNFFRQNFREHLSPLLSHPAFVGHCQTCPQIGHARHTAALAWPHSGPRAVEAWERPPKLEGVSW